MGLPDSTPAAAFSAARATGAHGGEHVVEFYETEAFLIDTVSHFVGPALHDAGAAIIVATAEHRSALKAALRGAGIDVEHAIAAGRYLAVDAAELLAGILVDGAPDRERFTSTIGALLARAGADRRRVRIYGEMVALLWDAGDAESAVALENLWNELAAAHAFSLLCAYPIGAFHGDASVAALQRICQQHTTVIPSEGYSLLEGADAKRREVARLQQENAALRSETRRLRAERAALARHAHGDALHGVAMQTIVEGVLSLDDDGRLIGMNAAAERMLGWTDAELRGHRVEELIHRRAAEPEDPPGGEAAWTFSERRTVRMRRDCFIRRDGRVLPVVCSASPDPGGGTVIAFSDGTRDVDQRVRAQRGLDAVTWVSRVREALDEDRLQLHSQPILPLRGGAAREELLLRMVTREGEVISAATFLPAVEELGLIVEIDGWVIARAARFAALGRIVQVNVSAASIADPGLLGLVERELEAVRAPASNLILEVTEAALMSNPAAGAAFAAGLRGVGCGLALDDFGTGSGSFSYLSRLSVQSLKIDVDFVRELPAQLANQHLVQAIVGLAQSFGHETIAVGVEDMETLALLREYGVDYAQGFAINDLAPVAQRVAARPVATDERRRVAGDRARLVRTRLLDHRESQRLSSSAADAG